MKKVRIIVKANILDSTGNKFNDADLAALDGIYYSPYELFEDDVHPIEMMKKLTAKYEKEYEHINHDNIFLDFEQKQD